MKTLNFKYSALTIFALFCLSAAGSFANEAEKSSAKEEHKAKMMAAKEEVNKSCLADAEKAGCKDKEVGTGLMKCMKEYKEKNKDFKVSDACKEASKKMHQERRNKHAKNEVEEKK